MTEPLRVLLDVDAGIDDALAILYAVASPRLEVVGVTAVVGNVPVEVAARNAAAVLAAAGGTSVPVASGAAAATDGRGARVGPTNHGPDGLGGVQVPVVGQAPSPLPDPLAVLDAAARGGALSVAACAPLTNVAGYVPRPGVDRVVMVGGELVVEDEPEFNVGQDPDAAAVVLGSGVPVAVFPVDLFASVVVPAATVARLRVAASPVARLAGELLAVRRGHVLGDAGALVFLTHPELFEVSRSHMALLDRRLVPSPTGASGFPVDLVVRADGPAAVAAFVDTVTAPGAPSR